jgi:hypothetical protein
MDKTLKLIGYFLVGYIFAWLILLIIKYLIILWERYSYRVKSFFNQLFHSQ